MYFTIKGFVGKISNKILLILRGEKMEDKYLVLLDSGDISAYQTSYWETFQTKEELEQFIKTMDKEKIIYITEILNEKDFGLVD